MRVYGGVDGGCIDPYFLDLGKSWRRVVSFTPLPFYPREVSHTPFDRRLGGGGDTRASLDDMEM
jgi:hypothetical protein